MPDHPPDILLIVLDTLRRDRLSVYGHPQETSPHFDAFAAQATLFERAIAPAQWTIPAHASMFTGLYPTTHQVTQANSRLSPNLPTLAEILRANGYHTAGFCNNPLVGVLDNGLTRGFTDFYNYAGAAPNRPHDVTRSWARRALARRWQRFALRVSQRFAHNDRLFRLSLHPLLTPIWTRYVNYKGNTAYAVDDLADYITRHRQADGGRQPLFTFLNLMGGHMPLQPPQDYLHRFAPDVSRDRQAYRFMARFNADAARWASPVETPLGEWERRVIDGFYNAEVAHQDEHLGRLLHRLRSSGALDHTMVIIVADHGEGHGDHDFFGHSFVVYQELVHVPLLIHYPGAYPPGTRVETNVSTRRLFHTILDAASVIPPIDDAHPNADVSGLSLVRATNGRPDTEAGLAFAEAIPPQMFLSVLEHRSPDLIERRSLYQPRRGLYRDSFKLAQVGDRVEGLFDIMADPAELQNVADQQQDVAVALQHQLNQFVAFAEQMRVTSTDFTRVSDDVLDNLRALGYIE
ncbi:MAG: sulfatase [Chloroflexota bacterium]